MKKIILGTLLSIVSLWIFAQSPVIEGRYLPVLNTSYFEIVDSTSSFDTPIMGENIQWDYSNSFTNIIDTALVSTVDATTAQYASSFPNATHKLETEGLSSFPDNTFFIVDTSGFNVVGIYNENYNIASIYNPQVLAIPGEMTYQDTIPADSRSVALGTIQGVSGKSSFTTFSELTADGYGTLSTPYGDFDDVLCFKETTTVYDSLFADYFNNGNYTLVNNSVNSYDKYHFYVNTTFGTSNIMTLITDTIGGTIKIGRYSIPNNIGNISGTIYDNQSSEITSGEVILYREGSNFTRDDILATSEISANGTYSFSLIPFGAYYIVAKANVDNYPNMFPTYYGDGLNWIDNLPLIFVSDTNNVNINITPHATSTGTGEVSGSVVEIYGYNEGAKSSNSGEPVPGAEVFLELEPDEQPIFNGTTDDNGNFNLTNIADGSYSLFVDMPGLEMHSTYNFNISNGNILGELNFIVSKDSIYPTETMTKISETKISEKIMKVFPNPTNDFIFITFNVNNSNKMNLEICDITGKTIKVLNKGNTFIGKNTYSINLKETNIDKGIYFVKLNIGEKEFIEKVVIL